MSASGSNYQAPVYHVPSIVRSMGTMLRGPRRHYSTNFADVFSPDREEQHQYVDGLLAMMVAFLLFFILWVFVLLALKFRGKDVGCASGQAFRTKEEEEDLESTDDDDASIVSSIGSSSRGSSHPEDENSVSKLIAAEAKKNSSNDEEGGPPTDDITRPADEASFDDGSENAHLRLVRTNQREKRTRFCFLVFGLLSLICVSVILVTSFGPLKEASITTGQQVTTARDILLQVNSTLGSIENATASASVTVESAPLDFQTICPNITAQHLKQQIGVDLNAFVVSISDKYKSMVATSEEKVASVRSFLEKFDQGLTAAETAVAGANSYMWIAPAVLFAVSLLTAIAMLGVLLAWRGKSGRRVQNTMSYVFLPLLMIATIATWIIIIAASLATMVGSDMCTASTSKGSPDETIQDILHMLNLGHNSTTYRIVSAYTDRCLGPSPTQDIDQIQSVVQDIIDSIWQQISMIDAVGSSKIVQICGGNDLENLLSTARSLAKILTSIRRLLESTSGSLSCSRINPIYVTTVQDAVCTKAASAVSSGFFMFLILGLALLAMISLRASWLQNIKQEKVYHDESEVAENMILDEHEEYLAYISKYKHEWQEYRGFDEQAMDRSAGSEDDGSFSDQSECSVYFDEEDDYHRDAEGYNGSMEGSDEGSEGDPSDIHVAVSKTKLKRSDPPAAASMDSRDEISLPNLEMKESTASASIAEEDFFRVPSSMLPPPNNPDYQDDTEDFITGAVQSILAKQPSKSFNLDDGRSVISRQSSKSTQVVSNSSLSRGARLQSNAPTADDPKWNFDGKQRNSGRFFERYGIDPGESVRRKASVSPRPSTLAQDQRPPQPWTHAAKVSQSVRPDLPTRNSAQAHPLPGTHRIISRSGLPSGRAFFKADPTGNLGEMEVQLHTTPYSPRGPSSKTMQHDTFEC